MRMIRLSDICICAFKQMHLFFNTFMTNAFILYAFASKLNRFVHLNKCIYFSVHL